MIQEPNDPARTLIWDIETSNLDADFGRLLCIGYKWLGEPEVYCPSIVYPKQGVSWDQTECDLLNEFLEVYKTADISVTYNGILFDLPYINTKNMKYNPGEAPPPVSQVDLYFTVKAKTRLARKSLQNLSYFLGGEFQKSGVEGRLWLAAREGNQEALDAIIEHCEVDVLALEEDYMRLRPYIGRHPRVSHYMNCRYCGSKHMQMRGRYVTKDKNPKRRVQCMDCGGWDTRLPKELGLK